MHLTHGFSDNPVRPPRAVPLLALTVMLAGCETTEPMLPALPAALQVEPESVVLEWGRDSASFTASLLDQHGHVMEDWPEAYTPNWSVTDTDVAKLTSSTTAVTAITAEVRSAARGGATTLIAVSAGLDPAQVDVTVGPPPHVIAGELSFQYEGDRSGTFSANGDWSFDHDDSGYILTSEYLSDQGAWVAYYYNAEEESHYILARRLRADGKQDRFAAKTEVPFTTPGVYELAVTLTIGYEFIDGRLGIEAEYIHGSGTIDVTELSADRVSGTLSFILEDRSEDPWAVISSEAARLDAPLIAPPLP